MFKRTIIISLILLTLPEYPQALEHFSIRLGYGFAWYFYSYVYKGDEYIDHTIQPLDLLHGGVGLSPLKKLDIGIEYQMNAFTVPANLPMLKIYKTDVYGTWSFFNWYNKPFLGVGLSCIGYTFLDDSKFTLRPTVIAGLKIQFPKNIYIIGTCKDIIGKFKHRYGTRVNNILIADISLQLDIKKKDSE